MLMLTLRPCLTLPCPGSKTVVCFTILFSRFDVIVQLTPTIDQHYRSLIRRLVGAGSFVELRDGAIHGGPTLARGVNGFLG